MDCDPHLCGKAIIGCVPISLHARGLLSSPPQEFVSPRPAFERQERQFARAFASIRQGIAERAFPGAALAITYRGELVAAQGFGRFTYDEKSAAVQPDTVFDLASLTKVVATTAVAMMLHDRAELLLDEPVAKTMPEFVALAPKHQQAKREDVTIRMLLAHCSGLPAYEKLFEFATTRQDLINAALTTRLTAPPGTCARYSDIGFILLGELLARKAGLALDLFAAQEIFAPLRMRQTRFQPPLPWKAGIPPTEDDGKFRKRVIQGEVNDENAYVMGGVAGHAGVFAPASDVARFAECLLRGGSPLLKRETVKLFTHCEPLPSGTTRALGWDTPSRPHSSSGRLFSLQAFGHLGFTGTSLWIDPGRKLSVALLTNRTWPDRASQLIRQVRPQVHDAIVEALEGS
ncbi:MAG: serine hydrolase domain-containing protein [Candidatus Korobacteraceae bacterium]|jgi:CubicO group peptidase (beta-lactamase class C family)